MVAPIAREMAEVLGWDAQRTEREAAGTRERLAADLSFSAKQGE